MNKNSNQGNSIVDSYKNSFSSVLNSDSITNSLLGTITRLVTDEDSEENKVDHKEQKEDTTNQNPLKILHIGAEVMPFSSVGGLSMVISYLSKALVSRGNDVRVFMPKFGFIDEDKYKLDVIYKGLKVRTGYKKGAQHPTHLICNVKKYVREDGVIIYFLENMEYYEKRSNVYAYSDDHVRWALLCNGALKFIRKNLDWKPDVIHSHDWHTGLTPNIIKQRYKDDEYFDDVATVLTIHNIHFQGQEVDSTSELNFDDGRSVIPEFYSERLKRLNFLKRGIIYSDLVNTVSEGYARQILTKQYGGGLDQLLLELRSKLYGVTNGIDYEKMNPETDPLLAKNFSVKTLDDRVENKIKLQKEFGLDVDPEVMTFGWVGRLDQQKGIDLLLEVVEKFMRNFKVQFVLIGSGDHHYEKQAQALASKYPGRVGVHTYPNFTLPKLVFSGSDSMLMPSRWEPCGIVQMEAMRYGSVPIVRATGGLDDTVQDFDPAKLTGNGFKFRDFDGWSLYGQMVRAVETYRNKDAWRKIQINAMETDFSWSKVAKTYEDLYKKAMHFKAEGYVHGAQIE